MKGIVFVCCESLAPSPGYKKEILNRSLQYCRDAALQGYIPLCPQIYFPNFLNEKDREIEFSASVEWLKASDVVWQYGLPDNRMRKFIELAKEWNIPITQKQVRK